MKNRIEENYERERALRIEGTKEIRARRVRINQIAEDALRGMNRTPLPVEEQNRREETKTEKSTANATSTHEPGA